MMNDIDNLAHGSEPPPEARRFRQVRSRCPDGTEPFRPGRKAFGRGKSSPRTRTARRAPPNSGNALFLILIAVALFAALSYAVTQSGRDGASTSKETTALLAAQIVQQAATVATAVQRMTLTGTAVADLQFCTAGDANGFCAETGDGGICTAGTDCVFAPEGGGVAFQEVPGAALASGSGQSWRFFQDGAMGAVSFVATATPEIYMVTSQGFNILTAEVCIEINRRLGIDQGNPPDPPNTLVPGQPSQCTDSGASLYTYYHALVER